jgi:polynucleotide 5'-hydroxyl-kinase GRC3/NOL9
MGTGVVWMVRGPAIVRVIGKCHVLGMDVSQHTIRVRAAKALPFEPDKECKLDVQGESWIADTMNAGTSIWREIAEGILSLRGNTGPARMFTVLIVGATDTGKSTFATYLANLALKRGIAPGIIDGDIGQGDLAPPSALGAAVLHEPIIDLRDASACIFEFVGSITPAGSERLVAQKLKSLLARTSVDFKIVNTDGYLDPFYKRMLASAVSPNVFVYLTGLDDDDDGLAADLSGSWKLIIAPSSWQAAKTHSDRIARRIEQYMRYITTGLVSKKMHNVRFQYRNRFIHWHSVSALDPRGMFVALGSRRRIVGFGIIESMDQQHVSIRTDVKDFSTIQTSEIRLRNNHEERITGFFRAQGH